MADLPLQTSFALANPVPLSRPAIEHRIETLIALLDAIDGDPDFEIDDEDCCAGFDDLGGETLGERVFMWGPGDPEDAEDEQIMPTLPRYGEDQSAGPINEREAYRSWQVDQDRR